MTSSSTAQPVTPYAGQRLGLPAAGPGAVAGWGRRVLALVIDWFASLLVAAAFAGPQVTSSQGWQAWLPMVVFFAEAGFLTALVGGSFGQLVVRVVVVRVDHRPLSLLRALARTLLICLVVPPLVFDRDRRGLHDILARTITLRR